MEVYLIGVLMSWLPWLMGVIAITLALFFIRHYVNVAPFKTGAVLLFLSFFFSAIQPNNTYKVVAVRSPNPPAQMVEKEIVVTAPLIEQGKEERQKRFENLVDYTKD